MVFRIILSFEKDHSTEPTVTGELDFTSWLSLISGCWLSSSWHSNNSFQYRHWVIKLAGLSSAARAEPAVGRLWLLVVLLKVELVLYFCLSCGPEIRILAYLCVVTELTEFQASSTPSSSLYVSRQPYLRCLLTWELYDLWRVQPPNVGFLNFWGVIGLQKYKPEIMHTTKSLNL
jgi:hypothetical protein